MKRNFKYAPSSIKRFENNLISHIGTKIYDDIHQNGWSVRFRCFVKWIMLCLVTQRRYNHHYTVSGWMADSVQNVCLSSQLLNYADMEITELS